MPCCWQTAIIAQRSCWALEDAVNHHGSGFLRFPPAYYHLHRRQIGDGVCVRHRPHYFLVLSSILRHFPFQPYWRFSSTAVLRRSRRGLREGRSSIPLQICWSRFSSKCNAGGVDTWCMFRRCERVLIKAFLSCRYVLMFVQQSLFSIDEELSEKLINGFSNSIFNGYSTFRGDVRLIRFSCV